MRRSFFPLSMTIFSLNVAYAETDPSMDRLLELPFEELVDMEIISATKVATKLSVAPSTVTTYGYQEIKDLGARTLSDILVLVPGVHIQVKGNNRQKIWVRGVQSEFNNKIAMYIDNIPVRNAFNEFPIDEELPIESIKKVEIIRGPGSALYGANAFAAVINVYTFKPGERENLVKFGIGENDTVLGYFSAGTNLSDIADVVLEGKWLTTDGRKPNYDRKGNENSRSGEQQLGHIRFKLSALDKDLLFSASYNNFDNTRVDKSEPIENDRVYESMRFSLAYAHQFSNWGVDFNTYYTQSKRLETEIRFPILEGAVQTRESQFIDTTELIGFYSAVNYQAFESNQLVLGVDVKRERLLESKFSNSLSDEVFSFVQPDYQDLSLLDAGLFLQDSQYFFDKKMQLTVGLRYDMLELFENQFSYRVGLTHAFTDNISAKILYGTAYRSPSFLEFTRSPEGSELPDVETMQTIEAQVGYHSKILQLSLTAYYNNYKDFISRKNSFHSSDETRDTEVFSNIDNQRVTGVELESKYLVTPHWDVFLNASWAYAKSLNEDEKLPLLADWTVTSGVEWHRSFSFGEIRFNNHIVSYGHRRDWSDDLWNEGQQQRYPNRDDDFNDAFVTLNSSLLYTIQVRKKQTLEFSLTAHNLLDEDYYTQTLSPPNPDLPATFDNQYQGRHIRFAVSYSWQ